MPRIVSREELSEMIGVPSEPSAWLQVDQGRIDRFAEATGDHQFIHVDPERAAQTPFGGTIAHGFLSLSLIPHLLAEISTIPSGVAMGINYGLDKVRFLQPVVTNSAIRAHVTILEVSEKGPDRILVTGEVTVEIRGQEKPALVAETLTLWVLR